MACRYLCIGGLHVAMSGLDRSGASTRRPLLRTGCVVSIHACTTEMTRITISAALVLPVQIKCVRACTSTAGTNQVCACTCMPPCRCLARLLRRVILAYSRLPFSVYIRHTTTRSSCMCLCLNKLSNNLKASKLMLSLRRSYIMPCNFKTA